LETVLLDNWNGMGNEFDGNFAAGMVLLLIGFPANADGIGVNVVLDAGFIDGADGNGAEDDKGADVVNGMVDERDKKGAVGVVFVDAKVAVLLPDVGNEDE
jgi:hypothetical protein